MLYKLVLILFLFTASTPVSNFKGLNSESGTQDLPTIRIKKSPDFKVTGDGGAENWTNTKWIEISQRRFSNETHARTTKVKILYSENGIYFLFNCVDKKLTSSMNADFMDLWKEDVVEVFLWTDENDPTYFEYEISPLNFGYFLFE